MATSFLETRGNNLPSRPHERGYHVVYRDHEVNHCPGCGRSQWLIGRMLAECAFCSTALPLENGMLCGNQTVQHSGRRGGAFEPLAA